MPDYLDLLRQLVAVFGPREAEAKMLPMDDRASRMIKLQREAQAPAAGTPEAEDPLTGRWFSPERRSVYQDIGRATQAHPEPVAVMAPREWPEDRQMQSGVYFPTREEIYLAPTSYLREPPVMMGNATIGEEATYNIPPGSRTKGQGPMPEGALPVQDTLAHEQLHFLMYKLMAAAEAEAQARRDPHGGTFSGERQAYGHDDLQHQLIAYLLGKEGGQPLIRQGTFPEPMSGTHPPAASPEISDAYRRLIHQIFPEGERRDRALAGLGAARGGTLLEELR